jgi:hypothetical protein
VPISDNYFVQSLLQSTKQPVQPPDIGGGNALQWLAKESDGFRATLNGVQLDLDSVPTRGGPRLYLTLTRDRQRAYVEEPANMGLLSEDYESESQRELARLLRELYCAVAVQCSERERLDGTSPIRDALFQRVLFGDTDPADPPMLASRPRSL